MSRLNWIATVFWIGVALMKEHKLRLSHYDVRWKQEFEQMRSCVFDAAQGWVTAVEHIGSTAFPEAIARPCVDLLGGVVTEAQLEDAAELIEGLNFRRQPKPKWLGNEAAICLLKDGSKGLSYSVILSEYKSQAWYRIMRLKLWFERRPHDLQRLMQAKLHLRESEADPAEYDRGKSIFFSALEDQIDASEEKQ